MTLIGHDHILRLIDQTREIEPGDALMVGPAPFKVGRAVDAIVERTGKGEIGGEKRFNGGAIVISISLIATTHDVDRFRHHDSPLQTASIAIRRAKRKIRPIGSRLFDRARKGWPSVEASAVRAQVRQRLAYRMGPIRIE